MICVLNAYLFEFVFALVLLFVFVCASEGVFVFALVLLFVVVCESECVFVFALVLLFVCVCLGV